MGPDFLSENIFSPVKCHLKMAQNVQKNGSNLCFFSYSDEMQQTSRKNAIKSSCVCALPQQSTDDHRAIFVCHPLHLLDIFTTLHSSS